MQNKKYFTQEQIDKLQFMEKHFRTVVKCQWKSATTVKDNNIVADIYEETTGEKLKRNWGCNNCIFNVFKKVGTLYFESINYLEKQKEIANENNKSTESSASTLDKRREALAKARAAKAATRAKKSEDNNNEDN